jgi:hypothetical protein
VRVPVPVRNVYYILDGHLKFCKNYTKVPDQLHVFVGPSLVFYNKTYFSIF